MVHIEYINIKKSEMLKTYHYKFSCRLCMHLSCSSHSHSSISVRSDFYYCVSSQGLGTVEANRNICFFFSSHFLYNIQCAVYTEEHNVMSSVTFDLCGFYLEKLCGFYLKKVSLLLKLLFD